MIFGVYFGNLGVREYRDRGGVDDKDGARRVMEPGMDTAAVLEVSARRLIRARCKINIAMVGYRRKL